ncbi:MAG: SWIM zinc finger family protein [Acidimicrobiia bacterium]
MSTGPGALASAMLSAAVAGRADPARFGRGRAYVRDGAVVDLVVTPGELSGAVMGSRAAPYRVSVRVPGLGERGTVSDDTLVSDLNRLVPSPRELRCDCTCPDDADPCKHAVAVLLAFAQQIAIHPELLGEWRSAEVSTSGPGTQRETRSRGVPAPLSPRASPSNSVRALGPPAVRPGRPAPSPEVAAFLGDPHAELPVLPDLEPLPLGAARVGDVDIAAIVADALELIRSTYYDRSRH